MGLLLKERGKILKLLDKMVVLELMILLGGKINQENIILQDMEIINL